MKGDSEILWEVYICRRDQVRLGVSSDFHESFSEGDISIRRLVWMVILNIDYASLYRVQTNIV